jgi:hypothetical protein
VEENGSDERLEPKRFTNPFYVLTLVVGTAFLITCFAYSVMTVNEMDPYGAPAESISRNSNLIRFLKVYGLHLLVTELVLLAICTFAAIGTDDFWHKRAERSQKQSEPDSD